MKLKRMMVLGLSVVIIGGTAAFAASPAENYADIASVTVEEAYAAREEGQSFGQLAEEQGLLDEFKVQILADKKVTIEQRVEEGLMTREEADEFFNKMEANMENCDPGNPSRLGKELGMKFGNGNGKGKRLGEGQGKRDGTGTGMRKGAGRGNHNRNNMTK